MKRALVGVSVLAALCGFGPALAQPSPSAVTDPVKLGLARQVLQASCRLEADRESADARLRQLASVLSNGDPSDQARYSAAIVQDWADEMRTTAPQLLEQEAAVYARELTEAELRDLLKWTRSPSGCSIARKGALLSVEIRTLERANEERMAAAVVQGAVSRMCDEKHCTDAQRQLEQANLAQSFGLAEAMVEGVRAPLQPPK